MIFAPRSCPSSPGLAINTRIVPGDMSAREYCKPARPKRLGDRNLFVSAKHLAQRVANLPERGVGFHGVVEIGHQVLGARGGAGQFVEPPAHLVSRSLRA